MRRGGRIGIDGTPAAAYLAAPRSGRGGGVVVLPPAAGLPDVAVSACERLAREGFVAVAPDVALCGAEAAAPDPARAVCDAAVEQLFREPATEGTRVGVLVLGSGAWLALDLALRDARIAALAVFGDVPSPGDDAGVAEGQDVPKLIVCGEKEAGASGARAADLEARRAAGEPWDLRTLPGVGSDFYDESRADVYDPAAAEAAWDAALALLRSELA